MQLRDEKQSHLENEEHQIREEEQEHSNFNRETLTTSVNSTSSQPVEKASAWNWLQFVEKIAMPFTIALLGTLFSFVQWQVSEARGDREQKLAHDRQEQERTTALDNQHHQILSSYLDQMTKLLLGENPGEATPSIALRSNDEAKSIARARTLSTLRQLDGERKGQLLKFLYEADLIGGQCQVNPKTLKTENCQYSTLDLDGARLDGTTFERPIPLPGIDLTDALLPKSILPEIDLARAQMQRANLSSAILTKAILVEAQMKNIRLVSTNLVDANLSKAELTGAVLESADLRGAKLEQTVLVGANLRGANLSNADLQGADLRNADLTGASLQGTNLKEAQYNIATKFPEGFSTDGQGMRRVD